MPVVNDTADADADADAERSRCDTNDIEEALLAALPMEGDEEDGTASVWD